MVFSSALFVFYFLPAFLLAYLATPPPYRNRAALAGSLAFYAWGAPLFIFVLIASTLADFYIARRMSRLYDAGQRKQWLWLSILLNLGLLAYFKYANFFAENFNSLLSALGAHPVPWMEVALPVGISFFTFQKLSYVADVYQRRMPPLEKPGGLLLYIALFPHLIAGPIVRFHEIASQLKERAENMLAALISFVPAAGKLSYKLDDIYHNQMDAFLLARGACTLLLLLICFSEVAVSGFHPFIYFRF